MTRCIWALFLLTSAAAQDFDPALFRRPPVDFYPSVFWNWNDQMSPERIREQLKDLSDHQLPALCILPMPRDFRPDNTGNRLDVDYLSPEYFSRYKLAMDDAARLGMKAWLYDEGGWPSGSATGRVVKSDPNLGAQTLVVERRPLAPGEKPVTPPDALAAFIENGKTWTVVRIRRGNFQSDHLNPAATQRFIDLTHEAYRRSMPEYFGSMFKWAFTDEPAATYFVPGEQMPWTGELPRIFREQKGYDLIESLSSLLSNPPPQTPEAKRVRIDFFDVWSRLFQQAYLFPIRDWCRRYGLISGGHFGGEDETMGSARYGYGHILRAMRGLDMPGVDTIWRQLYPGQRNHHFPRYAGSVARQEGRSLVLTESFCVYGNGLTLAEMKWLIDYQYVRGCNITMMGNYPAGTSGNLMSGERPHYGPMNPLWDYQPLFQNYAARLGYMLSLGQGATEVGLYFPVRDFWAAAPAKSSPEAQANDDVALELEKHQVDFDFVDDDLLQPEAVSGGVLRAGKMSYPTLVFSLTHAMPARSAQTVARFVRGGGRLIAVAALPETGPAEPRTFLQELGMTPPPVGEERRVGKGSVIVVPLDQLPRWVRPTLAIELAGDSLRVTARRLPAGMIYLIANESETWVDATPKVPMRGTFQLCDPETGDITTAPRKLRLAPWGSACLLLDRRAGGAPLPAPDLSRSLPIEGEWQIHRIAQTVIDNDDYARRTLAADPWRQAKLGDWKQEMGADFSGTAEYRVSFPYTGMAGHDHFLDLGTVAAAAEVWLNGERLGARAWQPYWFHTGKALRSGQNELRIRVTNTLANYLVSPAVRADWAAKKGPGWPGVYDARAHEFETQSTRSGLFGPVRLLPVAGAPSKPVNEPAPRGNARQ
jgi:hypothetical protein